MRIRLSLAAAPGGSIEERHSSCVCKRRVDSKMQQPNASPGENTGSGRQHACVKSRRLRPCASHFGFHGGIELSEYITIATAGAQRTHETCRELASLANPQVRRQDLVVGICDSRKARRRCPASLASLPPRSRRQMAAGHRPALACSCCCGLAKHTIM